MSPLGSRVVFYAGALLAGTLVGGLICLKDAARRKTLLLDVLCYCGGSVLFSSSAIAIYGIWLSRSAEQGFREAFLGWVGFVPLPAWWCMAVIGAFIFGARWRYRIRHRVRVNSLQPTANRSAASGD